MSYAPCAHKSSRHHWPHGLQTWPQVWICTACDERFEWGRQSSYWGNIECKKCHAPAMDWVACSDACAEAMKAGGKAGCRKRPTMPQKKAVPKPLRLIRGGHA